MADKQGKRQYEEPQKALLITSRWSNCANNFT